MPNEKKKYGHVTADEAGQIISAASTGLKIAEMLSDKSNGQTTYKAQDMVLDPRLWPTLAKVLKIEGQSGEAELDFKKVAKWFNGKIQGICKASQPPVKELSAGEFRKAALAATRQRLVVAKKELKSAAKGSQVQTQAQAKLDEAKAILARQGWTAKPAKRKVKVTSDGQKNGEPKPGHKDGVKTGGESRTAVEGKDESGNSPQTIAETTPEAKPAEEVMAKSKPSPTPSPAEPKAEKFYISGESFPVKEKLKEMGAKFDRGVKQWWFTDEGSLAKGQKVVDDYHAEIASPKK